MCAIVSWGGPTESGGPSRELLKVVSSRKSESEFLRVGFVWDGEEIMASRALSMVLSRSIWAGQLRRE